MSRLKNIFVLAFLVLFTTETFGVYKFIHTCGNDKTFESFYIQKNPCCCGDIDEDEDTGGCCTNETTVIQFKEENSLVSANPSKTPDNVATDLFCTLTDNDALSAPFSFYSVSGSVSQYKLYQKPPPRVRYCVFLI